MYVYSRENIVSSTNKPVRWATVQQAQKPKEQAVAAKSKSSNEKNKTNSEIRLNIKCTSEKGLTTKKKT